MTTRSLAVATRGSARVVPLPPSRDAGPEQVGLPAPARPPAPVALPAAAEAAVRADRVWARTDERYGFLGVGEDWTARAVAPEQVPAVRAALADLEDACAPADRGWLLARVLALLSHFRQEANAPQVERLIAEDWAEDLAEYPDWAIEEAARRWRRTKKFRPAICEIRALAEEAMGDMAKRRDRLREVVRLSAPAGARGALPAAALAAGALRRMSGA